MTRLGLIHTSLVFVTVEPAFRELCAELLPDVQIVDLVDAALLADTMAAGEVTESIAARFLHLAQAGELAGCDRLLSLCSSLGSAAQAAAPQLGCPLDLIDQPMAHEAAARGCAVAVLATVPTTLPPTCALLKAAGCTTVQPQLVAGGFEALMAGQRERHDELVLAAAQVAAREAGALVLAQASMARLAPALEAATGRPVLTSPRSGMAAVARNLGVSA